MTAFKIRTALLCSGMACLALHAYGTHEVKAPDELNISHAPSHYDSLVSDWKTTVVSESFDDLAQRYINLDTTTYYEALSPVTDSEYQRRIDALVSPFRLPYNNIVRRHIVAYTTTHKALTQRMLGQSQYYFPMIERELEKQGLPLELKFLTVIESALRPTAVSPAGAVGLWQFMLPTGKHYGLEITSMVDARRDPVASTRAACAYLKDLYEIYHDWALVLASYNYGPGNVNKALQRAGSGAKTYWDIYPYLPKATRDYIPAFVAVVYAYHYHKEHNLKPEAPALPLATDTVHITRNLHFKQVSATLDIPLELLELLNPQFKKDIVPAASGTYPLVLPQREICRFIANEKNIYDQDSIYLSEYQPLLNGKSAPDVPEIRTYKVRKGDTLGAIARKHGVTVKQIMKWNKLASANKLRIGQVLRISL